MNKYFIILIKSSFIRAHILSGVRSIVAGTSAVLVTKGYIDDSIATQIVGLAVGLVSFWLGALDVNGVDKKIEAALNTPSTVPEPLLVLPEQEINETRISIHRPKPGTPGKTV